MRVIDYIAIKQFITSRGATPQYADANGNYYIYDDQFVFECILNKALNVDEVLDFETNLKPKANKPALIGVSSTPAFASKTFGTKNLYKRVVGQQYVLAVGDNTLMYTETFPWVKFMSLEVIGGEVGDYVSLYVLDTATGTYSGYPNAQLNQFGFNANIGPGFYAHKSEFDADVYAGLQIKIIYHSMSAKTVGINYVMNEVK